MPNYADLMFTKAVQAEQEAEGSKGLYDSRYAAKGEEALGADERAFLESRTSIYIASVNAEGWPYVQHRGGPAGFIKVLDDHTIGFADYRGNRQLITKGNLNGDDRVSIFAMDYPRKSRLKLQGHATLEHMRDRQDLVERMHTMGQGRVERFMTIRIAAFDWNCPQFITPRFDTAEITKMVGPELERLEQENAALKAKLAALEGGS
ncbi:MAG: pyridoxamine 5'-phosphate oxidase family protein [Pseudomonadota bacterium]